MFISECFDVNSQDHLTIGGCDTVELAKEFGTPLYVMDEMTIRKVCRDYKESFDKYYDGLGMVLYASKALNCKEICKIIKEEGLGLDVVSGGELYTALKADFPPERIHFHGNNKTDSELDMAIESKVKTIVVDNIYELKKIDNIAAKKNTVVNISLRIKPGIDAHTHSFMKTGQIDSKFGFALETGEAMEAVKSVLSYKNVALEEFHCHIGSQIFDVEPFVLAAQVMMDFMVEVRDKLGIVIKALNLGGGFGIKYTNKDVPNGYHTYMQAVSKAIRDISKKSDFPMPYIYIEPGRSIVGEAGITLYTVGAIKTIPGIRTYVSIDGGMTDNPRYALYKAEYSAVVANKASKPADTIITLAGRCCESGDLIQENLKIQKPDIGDIVAVFSTGAYNYSMASNYNRVPRPAIVMVDNSKPRVIIKRESYEDLIRNDV